MLYQKALLNSWWKCWCDACKEAESAKHKAESDNLNNLNLGDSLGVYFS